MNFCLLCGYDINHTDKECDLLSTKFLYTQRFLGGLKEYDLVPTKYGICWLISINRKYINTDYSFLASSEPTVKGAELNILYTRGGFKLEEQLYIAANHDIYNNLPYPINQLYSINKLDLILCKYDLLYKYTNTDLDSIMEQHIQTYETEQEGIQTKKDLEDWFNSRWSYYT